MKAVVVAAGLSLCTLLAPSAKAEGIFTFRAFVGDADSGISSTKTYTHAVDFGDPWGVMINGVYFGGNEDGGDYNLAGSFGNSWGDGNKAIGNVMTLLEDMRTPAAADSSLTLLGLTAGTSYITTFYNTSITGAPSLNTITTSDGGTIVFNQGFNGNDNPNLLQYAFTATGSSLRFSFDAADTANGFVHFGFSNEVVPGTPPVVPLPAAAWGGMALLGGLGVTKRFRRRKDEDVDVA